MSGQTVFVDAAVHGAQLDVRGTNDAAVAGGSLSTVTSATIVFSANDTGKTYVLTSTAGAVTTGTLTYVNSTTATMSVAAGGAITGGRIIVGTDDTTAWQDALDSALPGQVVDAAGFSWRSLVTGNLDVPTGVHLGFWGRGPFDPQTNPALNAWGPTFVMVQNSTAFVTLNYGSGVGDIIFYSANQKPPASASPTAYGAVITMASGNVAGCHIGSPYMGNAYIGIYVLGGRHLIEAPQIGALYRGLMIDYSQDVVNIRKLQCSPYWRIQEGQGWTPTAGTLDDYALTNAWAMYVHRSDAFKIHDLFAFGIYGGLALLDSPDTGQSPRCGYGMVSMADIDVCAQGIYAQATGAAGLLVSQAMLVANATGVGTAGTAGVATVAGGTAAPVIVVSSWHARQTFSGGNSSNGAGTLRVPATNPG